MSSYDNRYNDIDDEPDFDYVNDDYGFDMDDDKEPSARTSTGASKNHKKKKASKPVTIWSEIFSYIKILAAAVIIAICIYAVYYCQRRSPYRFYEKYNYGA